MTPAGSTITILVGAVLLRLTLTGTYRRYVRVGMEPWLLVAGGAVIALGVVTLLLALRRGATDADAGTHSDAHGHAHGVRVGWLLLAPIAALLLVAPPALGAFGVNRAAAVDVRSGGAVFKPLPASATPVPMTLLEYGQRYFDRNGSSLHGATVELTGFVSGHEAGGFRMARFQIACCAADAIPAVVVVQGITGSAPPRDQWVRVTGVYVGASGDLPHLTSTTVTAIRAPEDPYE